MLYATLDEAYNITSFKKPKKKKIKDAEPTADIHPYDKYDSSMIVSDDHSRTTSINHCDPLQAPPYVFPIEKKAKEQYDQVLKDMDKINTKIESNIDDELDSYLNEEEYTEYNEYTDIKKPDVKPKEIIKTKESMETKETKKTKKTDKPSSDKVLERIYELVILLLLAILIILMCEAIVRIAKN